jgi:hypothetical protein
MSVIRSIAVVLIAFTALRTAQQSGTTQDDTARRQDIYAVYSALFARPDPRFPAYLIVAKTSSLQDAPEPFGPKACVKVPSEYATDWNEILAEFNARKESPGTIRGRIKDWNPVQTAERK